MFKKMIIFILLFSFGCFPEGELIKDNYPILTYQIQKDFEQNLLDFHKNRNEIDSFVFSDKPKEFINYFIDFHNVEFDKFDNMRILFFQEYESFDSCLNKDASGCYDPISNTIIVRNNFKIKIFLNVFNHEFGHSFENGIKNGENCSMGNEIYSSLKMYQFSKVVGSIMLDNVFYLKNGNLPLNKQSFEVQHYNIGSISSLINLIDNSGDLDKSFRTLPEVGLIKSNIMFDKRYNSYYENKPLYEMYFDLFNELIEMPNFYSNMEFSEREEIKEYLKIRNYQKFIHYTDKNFKNSEYQEMLKNFINNENYQNEYFYNDVLELSNF